MGGHIQVSEQYETHGESLRVQVQILSSFFKTNNQCFA